MYGFDEEMDEQVMGQLRRFLKRSRQTDANSWYRVHAALARAADMNIYHGRMEDFIMPNLFDEEGNAIDRYYWRDPQEKQVNALRRNLEKSSDWRRKRGRVTETRLRLLLTSILKKRIKMYLNEDKTMEKKKIMCIVGKSGVGKTLASLHLKNHKGANVICSFTTRPPRPEEVEGRDHHFIDIVPDPTELIAYAHYGKHIYYACKWQVEGPCTVYVIDEKGLAALRRDHGDEYDIHTVLITRDMRLRKQCGVEHARLVRDQDRRLDPSDYDYVVENNGKKRALFNNIERIYEDIKNK